ncbi:MAG: peptidoglycan-binding protein [bacterium]
MTKRLNLFFLYRSFVWVLIGCTTVLCVGVLPVSAAAIAPEVAVSGGASEIPVLISVAASDAESVHLQWLPIWSATGYDVYRRTGIDGEYVRVGTEPTITGSSVSSYIDTDLFSSTVYSYRVSALNSGAESAASFPATVETSAAPVLPDNSIQAVTIIKEDVLDMTVTPTVATSTDSTLEVGSVATSTAQVISEQSTSQATLKDVLQGLLEQVAVLQAQLALMKQEEIIQFSLTVIPQSGSYTQSLHSGMQNDDVCALQTFLKEQGEDIYPEGLTTGHFGLLTEKAVQRFQKRYNIASEGDDGYGYVGPKTRTKLNELIGL